MIVHRGLGFLAFVIPIACWVAIVFVFIAQDYYEPDPVKAGAFVYRTMAAGFALGALALLPIVHRRNRTAPGVDDLAFIPFRYWPWIVALCALAALIASYVPAAQRVF